MADCFHDFENNCFQEIFLKNNFLNRNFVPVSIYYLVLFIRSQGSGIKKSNVFEDFVMFSLALTRVFHKKEVNYFLSFVKIDDSFVDIRHIMDIYRSQGLLSDD